MSQSRWWHHVNYSDPGGRGGEGRRSVSLSQRISIGHTATKALHPIICSRLRHHRGRPSHPPSHILSYEFAAGIRAKAISRLCSSLQCRTWVVIVPATFAWGWAMQQQTVALSGRIIWYMPAATQVAALLLGTAAN